MIKFSKYHVFMGDNDSEDNGMLCYQGLMSKEQIIEVSKEVDWGDIVIATDDGTLRTVAFWEEPGEIQLEEGFSW